MKRANSLLTVPKAAPGEMIRQTLIDRIESDAKRIVFVHAGAGYGKTTLLAQLARHAGCAVWLSLTGESDVLSFADTLCEAVRHIFPQYGFQPSECLPFMEKENFTSILANALIGSIENLSSQIVFVFDDLHTIRNRGVKELLVCFLRFSPDSMRLLLGSRETPWPEFAPLKVRGSILEIGRDKLAFTEAEAEQILGVFDSDIYRTTEGWPLAVGSFRVLLESGISPTDVPSQGSDVLSSYLFYECINRLPSETADFLKCSACFDDLDASMLDTVLERKDSGLVLDSLTARNLFTVKTGEGHYCYHALFQKCLLKTLEPARASELRRGAARYYLEKQDFPMSAEYAIRLNDRILLKQIILVSYRPLIRSGSFSELRRWFQVIGEDESSGADFLLAKGVFLSCIGNFTEAQKALDRAVPALNQANRTLYMEAMLHKARVLRNDVSFEASDELLNRLLPDLAQCEPETAYLIVVEKLYNLCWNSRVIEAYALARQEIDRWAREGNLRIKARLERFMTAVHFFAGNMREAVASYEKSLALPEEDKESLDIHEVGIYAAKAYQMLGDRERSLNVLTDALNQMKHYGKYEEMWSGYLFAAEVYFQNTFIDRSNGINSSYDITKKYFALADEYAPLYRRATYQQRWARLQRLTYSIMFEGGANEQTIQEIFQHLNDCGDYFKSIMLARLMGYFAAVHDFSNAVMCAKQCAEVGENTGTYLHSTLAYGVLARYSLAAHQWENAKKYTALFLSRCVENGIYEYFRALNDYGPVLQFAYDNNIERGCAEQLMAFAGFHIPKAYVKTFGSFAIFPFHDRNSAVKMRTKKERELFAFLLDAGEQGATKEQIYDAIWSESKSNNVKGLIGVNLAQLKKDLAPLGIKQLILCREKRYSVCRDEFVCDFELFKRAAQKNQEASSGYKDEILSLYSGEYLSDFEAFWATPKRIKFEKIYEDALNTDVR